MGDHATMFSVVPTITNDIEKSFGGSTDWRVVDNSSTNNNNNNLTTTTELGIFSSSRNLPSSNSEIIDVEGENHVSNISLDHKEQQQEDDLVTSTPVILPLYTHDSLVDESRLASTSSTTTSDSFGTIKMTQSNGDNNKAPRLSSDITFDLDDSDSDELLSSAPSSPLSTYEESTLVNHLGSRSSDGITTTTPDTVPISIPTSSSAAEVQSSQQKKPTSPANTHSMDTASHLLVKRNQRQAKKSNGSGTTKKQIVKPAPASKPPTRQTRKKVTQSTTTSSPLSPKIKFRHHLPTGYIFDVYMTYHATLDIFDIHPEDPRRLFYIYREMQTQQLLDKCERLPIKKATHRDILSVHQFELLQVLQQTRKMTRKELIAMEKEYDSIYVNNHSYESSLYAAGGVIELCKAVVADRVKNGFAIVRPPGHHAESNVSMGFCFINNVAIATKYCLQHLDLQKVMIVDWDVHFGNGTHEIFADDPNVLYLSLHRYDDGWFYPGDDDGSIENVGNHPALGRSVNIPWPTNGTTDADYLYAFHQIVMPIGHEFKPDLVIVSAGFDAADGDHIGMCKVTPAGYGNMTHLLKALANGRLVMALEGGYNLDATSISAAACMSVLMGEAPQPVKDVTPSPSAIETVEKVKTVQREYWRFL
ncbi:hypothetical protein BC941DRAFT_421098 [Chlamydoabsidia padenii]|nr:hypothetical protein BC941DRAFT_421098 [Chlamydoabsidia padenii]